jgi:hypothetical protein
LITEPALSISGNVLSLSFFTSVSPPAISSSEIIFNGTGNSGSATCQFLGFGPLRLTMATTGITITTIFQFEGTPRDNEHLLRFGVDGQTLDDIVVRRLSTTDRIMFIYSIGRAYGFEYAPSIGFSQSTPIRLAIQYDPTVGSTGLVSFWINGALAESITPLQKATDRIFSYTYIGKSTKAVQLCSSLRLYSLQVHNRVLSAAEIWSHTMELRPDLNVIQPRVYWGGTNSTSKIIVVDTFKAFHRANTFHLR